MFGDDLVLGENCLKNCLKLYEKYDSNVIAVQEVEEKDVSRYGIVKIRPNSNGDLVIEDLIEKPSIAEAPSRLAILGRVILKPEIFNALEKIPFGKGNELQLTDAMRELSKNQSFMAYNIKGEWLTLTDPENYLKTIIRFALHRQELKTSLLNFFKTLSE
jgi:UTP--glucose-1-phosphate uridylyltransferase